MSDLVERLRGTARPPAVRSASAMADLLREAADRIEGLEILCTDKTASITDLIEQLQKAEAQNAERTGRIDTALADRCIALESALRAMCCPYTDRNCENSVLARALMTDRTSGETR